MEKERWRCFFRVDHEGLKRSGCKTIYYIISDLGNVRTIREKIDGTYKEKIMKGICRQYPNRGYLAFRVRDKSYRVHRLVADIRRGRLYNPVLYPNNGR